mmetsp:Transcript_17655/g.30429  ORF Transcript_17655/g.30429 Transcript_17655/m.30429 type:complete len:220 (+) Transcript_17655:258-917(+)
MRIGVKTSESLVIILDFFGWNAQNLGKHFVGHGFHHLRSIERLEITRIKHCNSHQRIIGINPLKIVMIPDWRIECISWTKNKCFGFPIRIFNGLRALLALMIKHDIVITIRQIRLGQPCNSHPCRPLQNVRKFRRIRMPMRIAQRSLFRQSKSSKHHPILRIQAGLANFSHGLPIGTLGRSGGILLMMIGSEGPIQSVLFVGSIVCESALDKVGQWALS